MGKFLKNSVKESNVSVKKIFKLKLCWQKNLKKEKMLKIPLRLQ